MTNIHHLAKAANRVCAIAIPMHHHQVRHYSKILAWGSNDDGRLGIGASLGMDLVRSKSGDIRDSFLPKHQQTDQSSNIIASWLSDFMAKSVQTWQNHKKLVLGESIIDRPERVIIPHLDEEDAIVDVCCGPAHTIFVSRRGRVFTCGDNSYGQLGLDLLPDDMVLQPLPVHFPVPSNEPEKKRKVIGAAAGDKHSLFVMENGDVYGCGLGSQGQLGLGADIVEQAMNTEAKGLYVPAPIKLQTLADSNIKIDQVAAGYEFSLALDKSTGNVYSFGNMENARLGHGETPRGGVFHFREHSAYRTNLKYEYHPRLIQGLIGKYIDKIYAAPRSSIACSSRNNTMFTWGSGAWYLHGTASSGDIPEPMPFKLFNGMNIVQFASSGAHHAALNSAGQLFIWGADQNGCLGLDEDSISFRRSEPNIIPTLKNVSSFSLGHRFSAAIANGGKVYTWGCAESGVLGNAAGKDHWSPETVPNRNFDVESDSDDEMALQDRKPLTGEKIICGFMHVVLLQK